MVPHTFATTRRQAGALFGISLARPAMAAWIVAALLIPMSLEAQVNVVTNRYDGSRTGANLNETTLTAANVNVNQFGKLYSYPVDGAVYAQPLYVMGVTIQGTARNLLYVATMNDKVYAFDADSASPSALWMTDFTSPPSVTPVPITDIVGITRNIVGNVGIQSTPVIDRAAGTLYLVARTKENGSYVQRLHALDITTGRPKSGSPVTITGSVSGSALDSTPDPAGGRVITFNPKVQQQRAGLALTNGVVLISWAGHEDLPPYHGWIMGFDATTLQPVGVFSITPDVYGGGIWQGGRAPTIDAAGNAYFTTGNGKWDGVRNFGDSLLKFSVSRTGMALVDYFTPANEAQLSLDDDDLSGSGFTLLPGTNYLLGGGKEGVLFLLDKDNLGKKTPNDAQVLQKILISGGHVMGGPVYWNFSTVGPLVYNWSEDGFLTAYRLSGGTLLTTAYEGVVRSPGHPGGSLTISARGSAANTGIVWASMPRIEDAISGLHAGILRAYNAETLAEIWTSEQNAARDKTGTLIKFVPPMVANGKVYMANHNNAVAVYGLLPVRQPDFSVSVTPPSRTIPAGDTTTFSIAIGALGGFTGRVDLSASGAASGATVAFNSQSITGAGVATMTVAVPAGTPAESFNVTVTGTSGTIVHSATAVVNLNGTPAAEIVLYAKRAALKAGTWRVIDDPTAAGGQRLEHPDAAAAKVATPLAAPTQYLELTFDAQAGRGYRLWMRGRAQNNSYNNDSVYVQFDESVDVGRAAVNRIGTTQATTLIVEECSGCGLSGWGWADNGYVGLGPLVYFATTGPQTMRIQGREDGISIDQMVLSASTYVTVAPGATKNDTTILNEPGLPSGDALLYAAEAPLKAGAWRVTPDVTAAGGARIEHPDAGAPKLAAALANPANYFELTFQAEAGRAYHLWVRGRAAGDSWANDSVFVQFDGSIDASGAAVNRIGTTNAAIVTLEDCVSCGVSGWGWQDTGFGAGVMGPDIYFANSGVQRIRVQTREDGFSIDQILLSPSTPVTPPGALKNDTTMLPR